MRGRNISQNYYKTTLAAPLIAISGSGASNDEFEIQVNVPPSVNRGWIVVDFEDTTKRDLIFFHNVVGNVLKYYRKNRDILGNGALSINHEEKATVQMNDFCEWFNYISVNSDDWGMVEKIGSTNLHVTVMGGFINHFGTVITTSDTSIAVTPSVTSSIVFDFADNTFKAITAAPGATQYVVAEVVAGATSISTITDKRSAVVCPLFDTTEFEVSNGVLRIKNGAIDTDEIADSAITADKIAGGAVGSSEIADDAVGTSEIADDAVTSEKIASNPNLRGYVELDEMAAPSAPAANKARLYVREVAGKETLWMINGSGDHLQIRPAPGLTAVNATKVGPITGTPSGATLTVTDPSCTTASNVMNIAINSGTPVGTILEADTQSGQIIFASFGVDGAATTESGITFYYTIVY